MDLCWLTQSLSRDDCIDFMNYALYILCSLCNYIITFLSCDEKWPNDCTNLSCSYCMGIFCLDVDSAVITSRLLTCYV